MKRIFLAMLGGCLSAMTMAQSASSQNVDIAYHPLRNQGYHSGATRPGLAPSDKPRTLSNKALRDFKRTYGDAKNVRWDEAEDGYIAKFDDEGVPAKVAYNLSGNWQYTLHQGTEAILPTDVRAQVKSSYYDYSILLAQILELPDKTVYLVQIEGKSDWKQLRICDAEMQTIGNYKKD